VPISAAQKVENAHVLIKIWPEDDGWKGKVRFLPVGQIVEFVGGNEESIKAEAQRIVGPAALEWQPSQDVITD
jgi:hypothetical protein